MIALSITIISHLRSHLGVEIFVAPCKFWVLQTKSWSHGGFDTFPESSSLSNRPAGLLCRSGFKTVLAGRRVTGRHEKILLIRCVPAAGGGISEGWEFDPRGMTWKRGVLLRETFWPKTFWDYYCIFFFLLLFFFFLLLYQTENNMKDRDPLKMDFFSSRDLRPTARWNHIQAEEKASRDVAEAGNQHFKILQS